MTLAHPAFPVKPHHSISVPEFQAISMT